MQKKIKFSSKKNQIDPEEVSVLQPATILLLPEYKFCVRAIKYI